MAGSMHYTEEQMAYCQRYALALYSRIEKSYTFAISGERLVDYEMFQHSEPCYSKAMSRYWMRVEELRAAETHETHKEKP